MPRSHFNVDRAIAEPDLKRADVIIPVKNTKRNWKECLDSIYLEIPINRLWIGDGGCTDDTIEIVRKYPRVMIFDQSKLKTLGYRIKCLIEKVATEWFVYLHSDVSLPRGWFDEMRKYQEKWDWFECRRIAVYQNETKQELTRQYKVKRSYSGSQMGKTSVLKKAVEGFEDDYIQRTEDIIIQQNVENLGYHYGKVPTTFHYHYISHYTPTLKDVTQTAQAIIKYLQPTAENVETVLSSIVKLSEAMLTTDADWKKWAQKSSPVWTKIILASAAPSKLGQSVLNDLEYTIFASVLDIRCGERRLGDINLDIMKTKATNLIASAENLPLKDESISLVFFSQVLEHLNKPQVALEEINRVLNEKGIAKIDVPRKFFTCNMRWHLLRFLFNLPFSLKPREIKWLLSDTNAVKEGDPKRSHKHIITEKLIQAHLTVLQKENFAPIFLIKLQGWFGWYFPKIGLKTPLHFSRLNGGVMFTCAKRPKLAENERRRIAMQHLGRSQPYGT